MTLTSPYTITSWVGPQSSGGGNCIHLYSDKEALDYKIGTMYQDDGDWGLLPMDVQQGLTGNLVPGAAPTRSMAHQQGILNMCLPFTITVFVKDNGKDSKVVATINNAPTSKSYTESSYQPPLQPQPQQPYTPAAPPAPASQSQPTYQPQQPPAAPAQPPAQKAQPAARPVWQPLTDEGWEAWGGLLEETVSMYQRALAAVNEDTKLKVIAKERKDEYVKSIIYNMRNFWSPLRSSYVEEGATLPTATLETHEKKTVIVDGDPKEFLQQVADLDPAVVDADHAKSVMELLGASSIPKDASTRWDLARKVWALIFLVNLEVNRDEAADVVNNLFDTIPF